MYTTSVPQGKVIGGEAASETPKDAIQGVTRTIVVMPAPKIGEPLKYLGLKWSRRFTWRTLESQTPVVRNPNYRAVRSN